jgi:hypothetical protein
VRDLLASAHRPQCVCDGLGHGPDGAVCPDAPGPRPVTCTLPADLDCTFYVLSYGEAVVERPPCAQERPPCASNSQLS